MSLSTVDVVWSLMSDGELYSPRDLANSSGQSADSVTRVLEFLKRYGFAEQVTRRESIFRKVAHAPAPGDALRILQTLVNDNSVRETGRVVTRSDFNKRP